MPRSNFRNSSGRRNFVAAFITVVSVGVLYSSFDPVPAGEEPLLVKTAPVVPVFESADVPVPPEAKDLVVAASNVEAAIAGEQPATASDSVVAADPRTVVAEGGTLNNQDALKFCLLLLQDGGRYIENLNCYTVNFHREERINGDMKVPQSISMKVQHSPHFAVYMKWLSGEKGQQVLYSDTHEDGCMVVKFGGFRRLLPALRIDPASSLAMAESRYPVTEAGIHGMIRLIAKFRESDLKRGHGVSCVRMKDQEFDGRNCYCFQLKYDSPAISETYRKSLLMIDTERHLPLMIRNYTWAAESEGLTEAELDAATLIENYSFTDLDLERELASKEFDRENPSYRM
ncbi:MAG: DUF1571 domain-containing protein [Fuerstiella sp.]|mgnify:FL=1